MNIQDCKIWDSEKLNDCYMDYDLDGVTYRISYVEVNRGLFTKKIVKRWKFVIMYDYQTRRYSDVPFRNHDTIYRKWDKIPKIRKQIAEDMKELYENAVVIIKKMEG